MTAKKALQTFLDGKKLDQPTIKRLHQEGYVDAREVTNMQSTERELLITFLTKKAERLLTSDRTEQEV